MARRVHVIGYRLGEGAWWKDRTPEKTEKEGKIEKVVRGIMGRYGYITSEVEIQKGKGQGVIKMEIGKGGYNPMYQLEYMGELIEKRTGEGYKISSRQEEKKGRNGEMKYREIAKSPRKIRVTMKERKWR